MSKNKNEVKDIMNEKNEEKNENLQEPVKRETNTSERENKNNDVSSAMVKVKIKSNTGHGNYYRNGLRFTPVFVEYELNKDIYESLKKDAHLTIEDD